MRGRRPPRDGRSPPGIGRSPWQRGTDVEGIVPPGRRLGDPTERRPTRWSASGVRGVVPPGGHGPGEGPSAQWARKATLPKESKSGRSGAKATAHRDPRSLHELEDPTDLEAFLQEISRFIAQRKTPSVFSESFRELVTQNRSPYDIVVGFAVLSTLTGNDPQLRRANAAALERGATVFFSLARRLDPQASIPDGLALETANALLLDLPELAWAVPYAYGVDAFCRQIELLREDEPRRDRELVLEARRLRARFIERRTYGDRALRDIFEWNDPAWTPRSPDGSP